MRVVEIEALGGAGADDLLGHKPAGLPKGCELLTGPAELRAGGRVVGAYLKLAEPHVALVEGLLARTRPERANRACGLPGNRVIFGSLPRVRLRNNYCRYSSHSQRYRGELPGVIELVQEIARAYEAHLSEAYAQHKRAADTILPVWRLGNTPFCTCNFNYNFAIPYHRDFGNQLGVFSNVLIARRGVVGGQLVLPEFGVAIAQQHGDLTIFDGARIVHGVTDIVPLPGAEAPYRCSIVCYSMAGMQLCLPPEEELRWASARRTEIESAWRGEGGTLDKARAQMSATVGKVEVDDD